MLQFTKQLQHIVRQNLPFLTTLDGNCSEKKKKKASIRLQSAVYAAMLSFALTLQKHIKYTASEHMKEMYTCCNGCARSACEELLPATITFCQTCVTLQHILRWFFDCFVSPLLFYFGSTSSNLSYLCSHFRAATDDHFLSPVPKAMSSHTSANTVVYDLGKRITWSLLWLCCWCSIDGERMRGFPKEIGRGKKAGGWSSYYLDNLLARVLQTKCLPLCRAAQYAPYSNAFTRFLFYIFCCPHPLQNHSFQHFTVFYIPLFFFFHPLWCLL